MFFNYIITLTSEVYYFAINCEIEILSSVYTCFKNLYGILQMHNFDEIVN